MRNQVKAAYQLQTAASTLNTWLIKAYEMCWSRVTTADQNANWIVDISDLDSKTTKKMRMTIRGVLKAWETLKHRTSDFGSLFDELVAKDGLCRFLSILDEEVSSIGMGELRRIKIEYLMSRVNLLLKYCTYVDADHRKPEA